MSLWSAEQRDWLQALGHELMELVPAGTATGLYPPAPQPNTTPAAMTRTKSVADDALGDPLLRAVLKAARRHTPDELAGVLSKPDALPRDPASKRMLWPRLRALRKQVPQR